MNCRRFPYWPFSDPTHPCHALGAAIQPEGVQKLITGVMLSAVEASRFNLRLSGLAAILIVGRHAAPRDYLRVGYLFAGHDFFNFTTVL